MIDIFHISLNYLFLILNYNITFVLPNSLSLSLNFYSHSKIQMIYSIHKTYDPTVIHAPHYSLYDLYAENFSNPISTNLHADHLIKPSINHSNNLPYHTYVNPLSYYKIPLITYASCLKLIHAYDSTVILYH
jgi:hypothetical protein